MWHLVDHWVRERVDDDVGDDLARRIVTAIEPTLMRHGITPARRNQQGTSAMWCSPIESVRVVGQEPDAGYCTDFHVEVNPAVSTISVHFEGEDLLWHLAGYGGMFEHPDPMDLQDDLDDSLKMLAGLIDNFCSSVLIDQPDL